MNEITHVPAIIFSSSALKRESVLMGGFRADFIEVFAAFGFGGGDITALSFNVGWLMIPVLCRVWSWNEGSTSQSNRLASGSVAGGIPIWPIGTYCGEIQLSYSIY